VQKIRCKVESIQAHGGGVYTLALRPERPAPRFRPGQFLHLALDPYDPSSFWPESRVFSIASSPQRRECLEITYSVVGRFTTRMQRELAPGSEVWVKLPYGDFVVQSGGEVALVAGGTGVTAFTAFLQGLEAGSAPSLRLFYGARRADLLIYAQLCGLRAQLFAEEGAEPPVQAGRLSLEAVWAGMDDPLRADYYLSGPPAMLKYFSGGLLARGVPPSAVRMDAWE
jgi:ferredoxin-NADP reductase